MHLLAEYLRSNKQTTSGGSIAISGALALLPALWACVSTSLRCVSMLRLRRELLQLSGCGACEILQAGSAGLLTSAGAVLCLLEHGLHLSTASLPAAWTCCCTPPEHTEAYTQDSHCQDVGYQHCRSIQMHPHACGQGGCSRCSCWPTDEDSLHHARQLSPREAP